LRDAARRVKFVSHDGARDVGRTVTGDETGRHSWPDEAERNQTGPDVSGMLSISINRRQSATHACATIPPARPCVRPSAF